MVGQRDEDSQDARTEVNRNPRQIQILAGVGLRLHPCSFSSFQPAPGRVSSRAGVVLWVVMSAPSMIINIQEFLPQLFHRLVPAVISDCLSIVLIYHVDVRVCFLLASQLAFHDSFASLRSCGNLKVFFSVDEVECSFSLTRGSRTLPS